MLLRFQFVIPSSPARIDDMRSRFSVLSGKSGLCRRADAGRGPRAAGPSGRRATGPSRAAGLLLAKPN